MVRKILVISVVHHSDPAIRYRIKFPLELIEGCDVEYLSFYDQDSYKVMSGRNQLKKIFIFFRSLVCLAKDIRRFQNIQFDYLIVKNYIIPINGSFIESLVIKKFHFKQLIYDIDDGVYLNQTRKENIIFKFIRNAKKKVGFWFSRADHVLVCNYVIENDLCTIFSLKKDVFTTFVTFPYKHQYFINENELIESKNSEVLNFIWLGSPHTQSNLLLWKNFFYELIKNYPTSKLYFIGLSEDFNCLDDMPNIEIIKWSTENELKYMKIAHFGLNPLFDSKFEQRKCAFKVFQYYRAGIIPIASKVGINSKIISEFGGCIFDNNELTINYIKLVSLNLLDNCKIMFKNSNELTLENNALQLKNILLG